jgi:glycosyltransferase involved in cell wall biosynthesis
VSLDRPWPTVFRDHPVPAAVSDPLTLLDTGGSLSVSGNRPVPLHIGFACNWEDPPQHTWSYSAWNLRAALRLITRTTDIGVQMSHLFRTVLRASYIRYYGGRATSTWSYSRVLDAYNALVMNRELRRNPQARDCDAALMIDAMAPLPLPFFVYYDSSWDAQISSVENAEIYAAMRSISRSNMERCRERQMVVYERAEGVITMSDWLARSLVEQSGVPQSKVYVVPPGASAMWMQTSAPRDNQPVPLAPERPAPRRRLLYIGRQYRTYDFWRKGGDLAVAALRILRREYDPRITLTIAGLETWPLDGAPPEGVRFLGILPPDEVAALYDSHDLFVMPSRLEPFGVVFVEALSRGLPCIARYAYAMPEIVTPGLSGALVTSDDHHELAATIAATLADDSIYQACRERAPGIAAYFSWERAARDITQIIAKSVGVSAVTID